MRVTSTGVLDHLVFAAPDLAAAVAQFTELTGVAPVPGGRHPGGGTANYLVGFGGAYRDGYLEIVRRLTRRWIAPTGGRGSGGDDLWDTHPT